jgi:hypothetical protein
MSSKLFGSDPLFRSNPLDARYTAHRETAASRRQTREWLRQRERELGFVKDAPPVAPDHHEGEKTPAPSDRIVNIISRA